MKVYKLHRVIGCTVNTGINMLNINDYFLVIWNNSIHNIMKCYLFSQSFGPLILSLRCYFLENPVMKLQLFCETLLFKAFSALCQHPQLNGFHIIKIEHFMRIRAH